MDFLENLHKGKIADALAQLKNQVQPSVLCITLRYNQHAPSWAQKRESRIQQYAILSKTPAGVVIDEGGVAKVLKPTDLESPSVFVFFNDKWYGDSAIYTLYTQNADLQLEALHADFKQILAKKFEFFNACITEPNDYAPAKKRTIEFKFDNATLDGDDMPF